MRYLLNAVAADGSRFDDLKERFTFTSRAEEAADQAIVEDWKGRGITPIPYAEANGHAELAHTLARWAEVSAINGSQEHLDKELQRLVRITRTEATEPERDLFDHFIRRADPHERIRLSKLLANAGADLSWLDAIVALAGGRA